MAETKTKAKAQTQAPQQAPTGNLPAVQEQKFKDFMAGFVARQNAYKPLLPAHVPFEKFQSSVRAALVNNSDLLDCIPQTFFRACAEAAELGLSLSPSLKEADILKVWNKKMKGFEAQFRPRFQGLMKLARQSGEIGEIDAHEVYKWDQFDYAYGSKPYLTHKPGSKPQDYDKLEFWGITHVYATWTIGGQTKFEVMDLEDVIRIMNRTTSKKKLDYNDPESPLVVTGPWVTDFGEMARKTAVRRASKYMPLSAERMRPFAAAVDLDNRREGGEEVTIDHETGEIVDITGDFGAEEQKKQPTQTQVGKSQMDDLETRMAGPQPRQSPPAEGQRQAAKAAPSAPTTIDNPPQQKQAQPAKKAERLDPPVIEGRKDLVAWCALAEPAVAELDTEQRIAWKALHGKELDACEMTCPDASENLSKMLP